MLIFLPSIPLLPAFAQYFNLPSMEPTTMSRERREKINENYTFISTDIYFVPPIKCQPYTKDRAKPKIHNLVDAHDDIMKPFQNECL